MTDDQRKALVKVLAESLVTLMGVHAVIRTGKSKPLATKCGNATAEGAAARVFGPSKAVACWDCVSCAFMLEKIVDHLRKIDTSFRAAEQHLSQMSYPKQPHVGDVAVAVAKRIVGLYCGANKRPDVPPYKLTVQANTSGAANFTATMEDRIKKIADTMRDAFSKPMNQSEPLPSPWARTIPGMVGGKTLAAHEAIRKAVRAAGGNEADDERAIAELRRMVRPVMQVPNLNSSAFDVPVKDPREFSSVWPGTVPGLDGKVSFDIEVDPADVLRVTPSSTVRDFFKRQFENLDVRKHGMGLASDPSKTAQTIFGVPVTVATGDLAKAMENVGTQWAMFNKAVGSMPAAPPAPAPDKDGRVQLPKTTPALARYQMLWEAHSINRDVFLQRVYKQFKDAGGLKGIRDAKAAFYPARCERDILLHSDACGICIDCHDAMEAWTKAGQQAVDDALKFMSPAERMTYLHDEYKTFVCGAILAWDKVHMPMDNGPGSTAGTDIPVMKLWED